MGNDIKLTPKQVKYLTMKTNISEPQKAYEYFIGLMEKEGIGSRKFLTYLNKMMDKDMVK